MPEPLPAREPLFDEVLVRPNVRVPMRDRVELVTDIYLPATAGRVPDAPMPALLMRTPYNKGASNNTQAMRWARHGYMVAIQDVRGRHASPGEFNAFAREDLDGYDAIEWLAAQPQCDGRVGTLGASYLAYAQGAAATQSPPHLAAMCHHFGYPNGFHSVHQGGALDVFWLSYFVQIAKDGRDAQADPNVAETLKQMLYRDWLERYPIRQGQSPLALAPEYEQTYFDYVRHDTFDDWWRSQPALTPADHLERWPDVPTLWVCGWFDHYPYCHADTLAFTRARELGRGRTESAGFGKLLAFTRARELGHENHYVVFGPWTHGDTGRKIGQTTFGGESAMAAALPDYELRWFDRWLKGIDDGVFAARAKYFVMGGGSGNRTDDGLLDHGGEWKHADVWPPNDYEQRPYYLQPDRSLAEQPPQAESASTTYRADPDNPAPSSTGVCYTVSVDCGRINPPGGWDQVEGPHLYGCKPPYMPLSARDDVLVFQTEPLERDVEVAGHPVVELWISSDAPDTDFVAKLVDAYPPSAAYPHGFALGVSEGIQRAKFRNSLEKAELLEPGRLYLVRILLRPVANLFKAGHRLRIDITSSSWPHFDVNTHTGRNPSLDYERRIAVNTIHHDRAHTSRLLLPVACG